MQFHKYIQLMVMILYLGIHLLFVHPLKELDFHHTAIYTFAQVRNG